MTRPRLPVPVPDVVTAIAAGRPVAAVWLNELGGLTFSVGGGSRFRQGLPRRTFGPADGRGGAAALGWNYGCVEEDVLLDAYGVTRDGQRIAYYRARWEQAPPTAG